MGRLANKQSLLSRVAVVGSASLRHHLPQLLEEVLDEDEALWLHIIVLRSRGGSDVPRYNEPVAFGMEIIGDHVSTTGRDHLSGKQRCGARQSADSPTLTARRRLRSANLALADLTFDAVAALQGCLESTDRIGGVAHSPALLEDRELRPSVASEKMLLTCPRSKKE